MTTLQNIYDQSPETFIARVNAKLIELAEENPYYVYKPINNPNKDSETICKYNQGAAEDCKGCIFGRALQELGWNHKGEMSMILPIRNLIKLYIMPFGNIPAFSSKWSIVQNSQDNQTRWEWAVAEIPRT